MSRMTLQTSWMGWIAETQPWGRCVLRNRQFAEQKILRLDHSLKDAQQSQELN